MEIELHEFEYRFPGRPSFRVMLGDCRVKIGDYRTDEIGFAESEHITVQDDRYRMPIRRICPREDYAVRLEAERVAFSAYTTLFKIADYSPRRRNTGVERSLNPEELWKTVFFTVFARKAAVNIPLAGVRLPVPDSEIPRSIEHHHEKIVRRIDGIQAERGNRSGRKPDPVERGRQFSFGGVCSFGGQFNSVDRVSDVVLKRQADQKVQKKSIPGTGDTKGVHFLIAGIAEGKGIYAVR